MQEELDKLYKNYLGEILSDLKIEKSIENNELSSPQFLDIKVTKGNYLNSDYKVLFIGKETNGWFNQKEKVKENLIKINGKHDQYIKSLKKIYHNHNLGAKYRSPIFLFIDILMKEVNKTKKGGYLLTELLRHDYKGRTLPNELIEKTTFENNLILRKEIEILRPNLIVFLTEPSYDKHIKRTYPMSTFNQINDYGTNQVAIIENIPEIKKAIRIYHPDFHNRLGAEFKHNMAELITKFISHN